MPFGLLFGNIAYFWVSFGLMFRNIFYFQHQLKLLLLNIDYFRHPLSLLFANNTHSRPSSNGKNTVFYPQRAHFLQNHYAFSLKSRTLALAIGKPITQNQNRFT